MFSELNISELLPQFSPDWEWRLWCSWGLVLSLHQSCTARAEWHQKRLSEGSSAQVFLRSHKWLRKQCTVLSQPPLGCFRPWVTLKQAINDCYQRDWEWDGKKRCLTLTT